MLTTPIFEFMITAYHNRIAELLREIAQHKLMFIAIAMVTQGTIANADLKRTHMPCPRRSFNRRCDGDCRNRKTRRCVPTNGGSHSSRVVVLAWREVVVVITPCAEEPTEGKSDAETSLEWRLHFTDSEQRSAGTSGARLEDEQIGFEADHLYNKARCREY